ncbi:hypothetical protein NQ314_019897 [Rhamnusium bicolor]|uniref:RRM domain-containing protein n=1 Tax=Rhamnusium bicolor TaxID=1586634 RepID=A0AAV8WMD6_9CUCU|nr:hypothetical protein NQ314_019897 [Rhamnusium bicolor]
MDDARTVWCGNLSDKVTEDILFDLFLQAAPLEKVKIVKDKDVRKSNFAFIIFKHQISVNYALKLLNGIRLFDKSIIVKPRIVNLQNQSVNRNILRNDHQNRLNQINYNEVLKIGQLSLNQSSQSNYDPPNNNNNNNNHLGHWEHNIYHSQEGRQIECMKNYKNDEYHNNRQNASIHQRRYDGRNNFNDRNNHFY